MLPQDLVKTDRSDLLLGTGLAIGGSLLSAFCIKKGLDESLKEDPGAKEAVYIVGGLMGLWLSINQLLVIKNEHENRNMLDYVFTGIRS